ncbi:MAG TPA: hypothetical protein PK184_20255 [Phycisphaerae bacterium]|jgi:hypothetical protein|nr:hypothetical protein [Phycisphaerae bacterium]HPU35033.1 hypothetical protein [Phycisphaerae bacterium]
MKRIASTAGVERSLRLLKGGLILTTVAWLPGLATAVASAQTRPAVLTEPPATSPASRPAAAEEQVWLRARFQEKLQRAKAASPRPLTNEQGTIAWGHAYILEGLVEMLQATREPWYAQQFLEVADEIIAARDDKRGLRDEIRGRILPAWGSRKYTDGKHYVWAVHTGMITAPMAQFAVVVKGDESLRKQFGPAADRVLEAAVEAIAAHEDQYRDGPGPDEGYLYGYSLKQVLPINQQNTVGRACLWLHRATGAARYRQRAERLLGFTLNRARHMPDGAMVWAYWPPLENAGEGYEDVSHASINADFMIQCVEHNLAPAGLISKLEKTFLSRVLLGPDKVADDLAGRGANRYKDAPFFWARLARHSPAVRGKLMDYLRDRATGWGDGVFVEGLVVGCAHLLAALEPGADGAAQGGLLGWWPLSEDGRDSSGRGHHGVTHGVTFGVAPSTGSFKAARFDGRDDYLEVPSASSLALGTQDFSVSVWIHTPRELDDVLGDIVTMYDPALRKGFVMSTMNYAGVTSGQSNYRNITFGIDNNRLEKAWTDCGRPGTNQFVCALTVHEGGLYAGTFEWAADAAGGVWRYAGGTEWVDCGSPDRSNAVFCLASFDGALYAGTARYLAKGSALPESPNDTPGGRVFRYAGGREWVDCGRLENPVTGAAVNVHSLAVYRGRLYASTINREGFGLYQYVGGREWKYCGNPGRRVETLSVYNGHLYATSYDDATVCRYGPDGKWTDLPAIPDVTQTYGFIVYEGRLHVTTWPTGSVFQLGPDDQWTNRGRLGDETEVMGVSVYNGQLYAGTLPLAQVYRYDGGTSWTNIGRLDWTPDVLYRRAWSMAVYKGRLYCGTLPSGHVYSIGAGQCVTYDHELKPGWRHLAGVRRGGRLELYVDGELVSESPAVDRPIDVSVEQPLRIGFGPHDHFRGEIRDVQLFGHALPPATIKRMAQDGRRDLATRPD